MTNMLHEGAHGLRQKMFEDTSVLILTPNGEAGWNLEYEFFGGYLKTTGPANASAAEKDARIQEIKKIMSVDFWKLNKNIIENYLSTCKFAITRSKPSNTQQGGGARKIKSESENIEEYNYCFATPMKMKR